MLLLGFQAVLQAAEQKITYDIKPGQDYVYYDVTNGANDDYILKLTVSGSWADVNLSPRMEWSGSAAEYPINISDCPDSSDPSFETFSFTGSTDPVSSASMHGDGWFGYVAECDGSGTAGGSRPTWDLDVGEGKDFGVRVPNDNPKYGLVGERIQLQGYSFYTTDEEGVGTTVEGDWNDPPTNTELFAAASGGSALSGTGLDNLSDVYAESSVVGKFTFGAVPHADPTGGKSGEETLTFHTLNLNIEGVDDDEEVDPGGYISVGTNNLQRINVILEESRMERDITLKVNEGAGVVKIWENSDGTQSVISDSQSEKEWLANTTVPTEMYVELLSTTTNSVVNLELSYAGHGGNTNGVDNVRFNVSSAKLDKIYSKQRLQFTKYYSPGGEGRLKYYPRWDGDFLLAGPTLYSEALGGDIFLFEAEVSITGSKEDIIFGVAYIEEGYLNEHSDPLIINEVSTATHFYEIGEDSGKYHVEITNRPDVDGMGYEGMGFLYFVVGIDQNKNDELDINEVDVRRILRVRLVDKNERDNALLTTEVASSGAAILGWQLTAYHLNRFHKAGTVHMFDSTVGAKNLDGDDSRLEHRVGANWDDTKANVPHIKYTPAGLGAMVVTKVLLNPGFINHVDPYITQQVKDNLISNIANEGDSQSISINMPKNELIFAEVEGNSFISDAYYAFGRAEFEGQLTVTATMVNGQINFSAHVNGVVTDLYDWDFTIGHGNFIKMDDKMALVQSGFPNISPDGKGEIMLIEAEIVGEVEVL